MAQSGELRITDERKEPRYFNLLMEHVGESMLLVSPEDGAIVEANQAAVEAYGYSEEEFTGLTIYQLRADGGERGHIANQMIAAKQRLVFEASHRRKDGSEFPVQVVSRGVNLAGKSFLISVVHDISARKQAELTLDRQKRSLEALHGTALALMNRLDIEPLLETILQQACNLMETDSGHIYVYDEAAQAMVAKASVGMFSEYRNRHLNKKVGNSGRVWATGEIMSIDNYQQWAGRDPLAPAELEKIVSIPLKNNGEVKGVFGLAYGKEDKHFDKEKIAVLMQFAELASIALYNADLYTALQADLAERKRVEAEAAKLLRAVEQSPSAVVITDPHGIIQYANPQFTQITGYSTQEARGNMPCLLTPSDQEFACDLSWKDIVGGHRWSGELLNQRKNGEIYWARMLISPMHETDGTITNYVVIQEDITQQKAAAEELLRKNAEIEIALEHVKTTQMQLIQQEQLAGIGQLAAGVAHEINNPLGFILCNVEMLQKYVERFVELIHVYQGFKQEVSSSADDSLRARILQLEAVERDGKIERTLRDLPELFQDVNEGLERVSKIVKGLKLFSRIDQSDQYAEFDLNIAIQNTLLVAKNEIKYYAEVETQFAAIPMIEAVAGQINQVLLNIIVNAAHAVKGKETGQMGRIGIVTYSDDKNVYCEIEDSGMGIPKDIISKIFNPFFTTKPVGQGSGLGLSISYDIIVNKHQGEIRVESQMGIGSKFIIRLPILQKR